MSSRSQLAISSKLRTRVFAFLIFLLCLLLGPLVLKELELRSPSVRVSPLRNHFAQILDSGEIRIDKLPCGNVLAPPPAIEISGLIHSIEWKDEQTLHVKLERGSRVTLDNSRKFGIQVAFEHLK